MLLDSCEHILNCIKTDIHNHTSERVADASSDLISSIEQHAEWAHV